VQLLHARPRLHLYLAQRLPAKESLMAIFKARFIFVALTAIVLLMSACGSTGGSSSSQTVLQVLQKSVTAMKHLKSAHIDMKITDTVNAASGMPTTTPTSAGQLSINLTGNGDEVLPDKFALHFTFGLSNNAASNINLSEIILGRQLFMQNSKGQWYVLSGGIQGASGNPFAGANISNYNGLFGLAQKAQITDHGDQTLNGQNLRHISVAFGQDALKELLNATGQTSLQQQQVTNKLLNQITLKQSTLDAWIDEATSYVHRLELKLNLAVKGGPAGGSGTPAISPIPPSMTTGVDTIIDYSKFNESITITAPAHAIPASSLSGISE
jgi:hypothetical protein